MLFAGRLMGLLTTPCMPATPAVAIAADTVNDKPVRTQPRIRAQLCGSDTRSASVSRCSSLHAIASQFGSLKGRRPPNSYKANLCSPAPT